MGVVYRGEHVETGERVAVKTTTIPYGSALAGLRCEIHALTRIHHQGIVRLVAEGIEGDLPWYAMELLEGQTLERYLAALWGPHRDEPSADATPPDTPTVVRRTVSFGGEGGLRDPGLQPARPEPRGPRPPAAGGKLIEVLTLMRRLCAPLTFLHGSGIVHRDLKPGNVFIRPDGTPVLVDFGLVSDSRGGVGREVIAVTPHMQGTLDYISPEQIRLDLIDARSDLYSLGCILYEAITGRCPFRADTLAALMVMHLHETPARPSQLAEGVPPALDALVLRLLAKEPRERIGHADDVAAVLAELGARDEEERAAPGESRQRPHLYRPQLHGRQEILDELVTRVAQVADGAGGSFALLGGESGVGKTYLAAAVAREAVLRGLRVVPGECIPVATPDTRADVRGGPLHPFRLLLQNVADLCRREGREAADRILGRRGKILAAYEPGLRNLPGQDQYPEPVEVPAQAERLRILEALQGTIRELARDRPLMLIIDDLQWADELSLSCLAAMTDGSWAGEPVLVLGTYRSDEVGEGLRELLSVPGLRRIELPRLEEETVGKIVAEMLAMKHPPRAFVRVLARSSEGNPFFVAEYLRAAVDERLLYRARGAWRLAAGDEESEAVYEALPLPRSLRELVSRRLHGLGAEARALAEVAAVLGREVDGELLVAVAGVEPGAALGPIKELLSRQVLEEVRPGRFRFFHDKLRETASENMEAGRRRALHGAAVRAIEARAAGRGGLELVYGELAHHATLADDLAKAIDYLEKAGEQAQRSFANHEAVRFFGEALALDARAGHVAAPIRRAAWERQLGNAYLGLGRLVESQQHLHAAVALLATPMPQTTARLTAGLLGQALVQLGHRLWPRPGSAGGDRPVLLEAARAYDLLMPVSYFVTGELVRILYATLRNLNLAERAGPSPELALAYANAQVTTGLIPWTSLAERYGRRLHETLEGVDDPAVRSWSYVLAGSYACGVGACEEAIALGEKAAAIATEVGFRRRLEEGLGVQGAAQNLRGDFRAGRDISHALWESALRGDPQTQVWGAAGEAQNCLVLGEPERALLAVERAERCLARDLGRPEKIICYGVLALTALRNGDRARAREAAERALEAIAGGAPIAFYCITAYSCVAETLVALLAGEPPGSPAAAALSRLTRQACAEVERSAKVFPVHRPRALLLSGHYEALRSRPARARRLWRRAAAAAARMNLPYDEALATLALAEALPPSDPERRPLLAEVRGRFLAGGALFDVSRVDALLAGAPSLTGAAAVVRNRAERI
jgi:tetratricopeptide (TPR) repeat protein